MHNNTITQEQHVSFVSGIVFSPNMLQRNFANLIKELCNGSLKAFHKICFSSNQYPISAFSRSLTLTRIHYYIFSLFLRFMFVWFGLVCLSLHSFLFNINLLIISRFFYALNTVSKILCRKIKHVFVAIGEIWRSSERFCCCCCMILKWMSVYAAAAAATVWYWCCFLFFVHFFVLFINS